MKPSESEGEKSAAASGAAIRVWDLPTRLFHWLLVLLATVSFVTGYHGGLWMQYHIASGCAIFGLVFFRTVWGFVGGRHARFSSFVKGPAAVLRYAGSLPRRASEKYLGHNPLGGWSVMAMLIALLVQCATGLFASDDIFTEGPLYRWVSKAASDRLTQVHRINQEILLLLIAVHIAAILFYLVFKRDNLIAPMVTGRKRWKDKAASSKERPGLAALVAAAAAAVVYFLMR